MKSSLPGAPTAAIYMWAGSTAAEKVPSRPSTALPPTASSTTRPLICRPTRRWWGILGVIYGGSTDGFVYALVERSGDLQWKFATSEPIIDSPVVIEDRVYATTELGSIFCLNIKTGKQIWWAPEILHFVAAGKQRIYGADKLGRLRILDARNGALLDIIPTATLPIKVCNGQTDRIYLAAEGGTIQCLRELEQATPVVYNESRKPLPESSQEKPQLKLKSKQRLGRGQALPSRRPRRPPKRTMPAMLSAALPPPTNRPRPKPRPRSPPKAKRMLPQTPAGTRIPSAKDRRINMCRICKVSGTLGVGR